MEVSESNKMEYIQLVAEYRLQESVKQEIAGFIKGLYSIIDDGLISIFDENELEVCFCFGSLLKFLFTRLISSHHFAKS